jgi:peptidyl-tRNA hydrolase, PTH1 family
MPGKVPEVWAVVGLGNPGSAYAGHRHNVGYLVANALSERLGSRFRPHKSGRADVVEGRTSVPGPRLIVIRPRAFMNSTGGPVASVVNFYRVPLDRLIVVHDELDVAFGAMRVKFGGGDNGHNGLRSIRASLGSGDFYRTRVGIGRPSGRQSAADFVLSDYGAREQPELAIQVEQAADAVTSLIVVGLAETQQRFNS